jgi:hypothetical protein
VDAHHSSLDRKETIMDANQRSEVNNQTNNGANEKWNPGSEGDTADHGQPLDHTYPRGLGVEQGNQQRDVMGAQGGIGGREYGEDAGIPGGSMDNQVNGGSGAVQGVTDSHQRQMEQKSGAYGLLEQPVGHRPKDTGVDLTRERDIDRDVVRGNLQASTHTQGGGMHGPRSELPARPPGGSMGNRQSGASSSTQGGGMPGPGAAGGREAQRGNTQLEVTGSRARTNQESDYGGVHESNYAAGGLPRSPGNTGADSTDRQGSQTGSTASAGGPPVHKSNDAAGGYPRSPGFANKLHGDENMDDDTGFKTKP